MNADLFYIQEDGGRELVATLLDCPTPDHAFHRAQNIDHGWAMAEANAGTAHFPPGEDLRLRSMMVGDAVRIDGRTYVCEPVGWEELALIF